MADGAGASLARCLAPAGSHAHGRLPSGQGRCSAQRREVGGAGGWEATPGRGSRAARRRGEARRPGLDGGGGVWLLPRPRRRGSGRGAGRRGSRSLFRGAGPAAAAPRLLPRQVRAARRNATGLTHQRLLPTCGRPIKRCPPAAAAALRTVPARPRRSGSSRAQPGAGRARGRAEEAWLWFWKSSRGGPRSASPEDLAQPAATTSGKPIVLTFP
ncbi:hypothetical protein VULLAG_LOCUS1610 [Vulpes lagopus]